MWIFLQNVLEAFLYNAGHCDSKCDAMAPDAIARKVQGYQYNEDEKQQYV